MNEGLVPTVARLWSLLRRISEDFQKFWRVELKDKFGAKIF